MCAKCPAVSEAMTATATPTAATAAPRPSPPITRSVTAASAGAANRLAAEQPGVVAVPRHQLVVAALLDHPPAVDHHDPVGPAHRGEPVRDEERGHPASELDEPVE